jgi:hypothetical protein
MKTLGLIILFFTSIAAAFPEMTTHGYVNCTTCHLSPSGGGLLTEYGRGLSKELLSMSSAKNEEGLLHGAVKPPSWLLAGGDIRAIQTYLDTPQTKQGEFFLMQAELAAAIKLAKWAVAATFGIKGGPEDVKDRNQTYSRVHYVMYQADDTKSIRVGRFMPQYGLNEPNHTITTRGGLGFGDETETDNAEFAYLGENWDAFLTAIAGRPDDSTVDREKGFALSSSLNFFERNKMGVSGYHGRNKSEDRWLAGIWGIFSLSKKTFLMSEVDHQWETQLGSTESSSRGMASYLRLGYEPVQGVQLYATHQLSYLDFQNVNTRTDAYGPGFDFYPRPHFEIRAEWLKERMMAQGSDRFDFAWLLLHYYF